jgi:multicomponent Na+:H+ antiporter subunit D
VSGVPGVSGLVLLEAWPGPGALASLAVLLPVAAALGTFVVPSRRGLLSAGVFAGATWLVTLGIAIQVASQGVQRYALGGWQAPLGIDLYVDGLAAVMLVVTASVAVIVSAYAAAYFPHHDPAQGRGFWPAWLLLWAGMNALYVSADLFNLYVSLEVIGITAVALVVLGGRRAAMVAGLRYLLAAFAGSLAYLLGVALLYADLGTLDLYDASLTAGPAAAVAGGLVTAGLLLKTGLFPLHFWLPSAHSIAPGPVSPVLSGLVVNTSFYLVVRLWLQTDSPPDEVWGAQILGLLAVIAIFWGGFGALRQRRLKLLIAYSTVSQLGYMFLLFPLAAEAAGRPHAWAGALYHAGAHALAKAALFLAAANILRSHGSDRLTELRGTAENLPLTAFAFGAAAVSLVGLPPSGGFVAKWYLVQAGLRSGQWWIAVLVLAGGLLTAAYLGRAGRFFFVRLKSPLAGSYEPLPRVTEWATLLLALAALAAGVVAAWPLELLAVGSPFGPLPTE